MTNPAPSRFINVVDADIGPIAVLPSSLRELSSELSICFGLTPDGRIVDVDADNLAWPDGRPVRWTLGAGGWGLA